MEKKTEGRKKGKEGKRKEVKKEVGKKNLKYVKIPERMNKWRNKGQ